MRNPGLLVCCSSLPKAQPDSPHPPTHFGVSKCLRAEVGNSRLCLTWRCSPALKEEGSPKPFNYFFRLHYQLAPEKQKAAETNLLLWVSSLGRGGMGLPSPNPPSCAISTPALAQPLEILACSTHISRLELPISELDKRCQKNNKVTFGEYILSVTK